MSSPTIWSNGATGMMIRLPALSTFTGNLFWRTSSYPWARLMPRIEQAVGMSILVPRARTSLAVHTRHEVSEDMAGFCPNNLAMRRRPLSSMSRRELKSALQQHVRSKLGGHQYPRYVQFIDQLPLTVTGKVVRRALRELASQRVGSI